MVKVQNKMVKVQNKIIKVQNKIVKVQNKIVKVQNKIAKVNVTNTVVIYYIFNVVSVVLKKVVTGYKSYFD